MNLITSSSKLYILAAALALSSATASAVPVTFTALSGTVGTGTAIFRADLTGLSTGDILSITLTDSKSKAGVSPGKHSGFDLDAIKPSRTLANTAAAATAAAGLNAFDSTPAGATLAPGTQRPAVDAELNGTGGFAERHPHINSAVPAWSSPRAQALRLQTPCDP